MLYSCMTGFTAEPVIDFVMCGGWLNVNQGFNNDAHYMSNFPGDLRLGWSCFSLDSIVRTGCIPSNRGVRCSDPLAPLKACREFKHKGSKTVYYT